MQFDFCSRAADKHIQTVTLVDFFYVPYMHYLQDGVWPTLLEAHTNLLTWWNRMKGRASYRQIYVDGKNRIDNA